MSVTPAIQSGVLNQEAVYNNASIDKIPNDEIQFTVNDQLFLETLLMEIRGKCKSYSSYAKKSHIQIF